MYHNIGINLCNIRNELHYKRNQDSLSQNISDSDPSYKIPLIVEEIRIGKNSIFGEKLKNDVFSLLDDFPIPIILEDYNHAEKSDVVLKANNEEKFESNSNFVSDISDPIDFTVNGGFVLYSKRHDGLESDSNIKSNENPLDAYRCSANETVLVNTILENEFISIAPSENFVP